jgi:hypothetical protein
MQYHVEIEPETIPNWGLEELGLVGRGSFNVLTSSSEPIEQPR